MVSFVHDALSKCKDIFLDLQKQKKRHPTLQVKGKPLILAKGQGGQFCLLGGGFLILALKKNPSTRQ